MQKTKVGGRKFKATLGNLVRPRFKMKREDWDVKQGCSPHPPESPSEGFGAWSGYKTLGLECQVV